MEFLYEYGLFFAKAATFVAAVLVILLTTVMLATKQKHKKGELEITDISENLSQIKHSFEARLLSDEVLKDKAKAEKKEQKEKAKEEKKQLKEARKKGEPLEQVGKPHLYVLDFKGSIDAKEVASLREEVTAVLSVAGEKDEVLVRLESGGGMVHGYGLASSQLKRLRDKDIPITVAVDKVAASGGYMMACVAPKIIAAPFAIIGSIGVLAQIPNFNKLLKKHDIDFEQLTAGEYKRTLTMFGENDEKGREKFKQELEETHVLFKDFVKSHRESLDIDKVATGEHWYGSQALEKGLVDEVLTSDDYLLAQNKDKKILGVKFVVKKKLADKLAHSASIAVERTLLKLWENGKVPFLK